MGLRWAHVDFIKSSITIEEARVYLGGTVIQSTPKTRRGYRVLPIWNTLEASLRALKTTQATERLSVGGWDSDLLAVDPAGRPILPRAYADRFKKIAQQIGLPTIPLKNARHTSVTLMRNEGVPDHIVAAWHGHDETVMRAVYSDAQAPQMRSAAEAVERF
jgi:integrase